MDTLLDIVLAPEVLAGALMVLSVLLAGKFIIQFSGEATELRSRLMQVEARLDQLRAELPDKRKRVDELSEEVKPLRPREANLRRYYDALMEIKVRVEREEQEAEEQTKVKDGREITKREHGL